VNTVRLKLTIEYDGTDFSGWQVQPGLRTVQGELETALERLAGRSIPVTGAGRTDAGVHAAGQVAHIDSTEGEKERMFHGLDSVLADDLSVLSVEEVDPDFHARFDALSRTYEYRIARRRHPLSSRFEHVLQGAGLDTDAMTAAASESLGENDWRAMAREGSGNSTWACTVTEAGVLEDQAGWTFRITANRFLRGMVRLWTGSLVEAGLGNRPPGFVGEMLRTGDRTLAGPSMPARGLTLVKVRYHRGE
jgi:tRNA pseudouridine38-40 synthase